MDCPQCGNYTEELHEGYCKPCSDSNENELFRHNHEFDRWEALTDSQREDEIKGQLR